jgi:hypothetical protein
LHQEDVAACFAWGPGTAFPLAVTGPDVERREALTVAIDLYNTLSLTSGRGERLPFEHTPWLFALGDAPLRPDGALALFAVALRRVPWEAGHGLVWEDRVPRALLDRPGPLKRWLSELSAPLWAPEALSVRYSAERTASGLVVRGEAPDLVTEAEVDARGVVSLAVTWRGVTRRAARVARVAEGAQ